MPQDYKYSLTRVCLRNGQLTLPRTMLELFPEEGTVTALDTRNDEEFELSVSGPRTITGLGPFFEAHKLDVNDEIQIRPLEDGRYAFTALVHPRRPDYDDPEVVTALLDELVEVGTPMTEAEIRALHPDIPADLDLDAALVTDPRLVLIGGRWQPVVVAAAAPPPEQEDGVRDEAANAERPPVEAELAASPAPEAEASPPSVAADPAQTASPPSERDRDENVEAERAARAEPQPEPRPARDRRAIVTPYPRGVMFPGDAALNSELPSGDLTLQNRARDALTGFGFRIEGLPFGQLMAHAELGRRAYKALIHVLPKDQRLDWAALLARRRETGSSYLAVFGDYRDLHRLHAPADLARATLWSWDAIDRVRDLSRTVLIGPVDLEPHFERDGLYDHGLERFERTIGQRIAERGVFSSVLSRLAGMRAPAIFLLEELAADSDMPRDQLLKVLERLGEAPYHLITRVDHGEFCLRYRVSDALLHLSEYALSLRDRLPARNRERVRGLAAPGLHDALQVGSPTPVNTVEPPTGADPRHDKR